MKIIRNIINGLIIGVANIIPGVSGGTMAVVLGIYDRILEACRFKGIKKNWLFLLTLCVGAGAGILAFSKLVTFLYQTYPIPTCFTFMGLILGSVPMLFKKSTEGGKIKLSCIVAFAAAFLVMLGFFVMSGSEGGGTIITSLDVKSFFLLIAAALLAGFGMILPGISGSAIMVMLGTYTTATNAVSTLNFPVLIPIGIGAASGILLGIALIKKLLHRFPTQTYAAILGLVAGSLISLYPGFSFNVQGILAVLLLLAGGAVSYMFARSEK